MKEEPSGLLVIDKPGGFTSHDVVAKVRRALGTRRVGHAGTLDPMATGVLVVLVGEATKLASFATAQEKVYAARIAFGRETATLDREGETTVTREVPAWLPDELRIISGGGTLNADCRVARAVDVERNRTEQVPPNVSAIQVDGERSYDRARRGESFTLEPRPVHLAAVRITGATVEPPLLDLELKVSKGFYIRSLARDLGVTLGPGAHLSELRRLSSGAFAVDEAVSLEGDLRSSLVSLSAGACRCLPSVRLTADGAVRARQGKALAPKHFEALPLQGPCAWLSSEGHILAIGETVETEVFRVLRGFNA